MLRLEFRWWIWLLAALIIYMIWRGPSEMAFVFGGLVHAFTSVGDAIVRGSTRYRYHARNGQDDMATLNVFSAIAGQFQSVDL